MTYDDAVAKAKRIWGEGGYALRVDEIHIVGFRDFDCGCCETRHSDLWEGSSWEKAFENAKNKKD